MQYIVVGYDKATCLFSLALVFALAHTTASAITTLFLSRFFQPTSQPYIYEDYPQINRNQTQQRGTSQYPGLLLNYSLIKIIRVLLPRSPTGVELLTTSHDSLILASAASSTVNENTRRSPTLIGCVPGFLKAFKQIKRWLSLSSSIRGIFGRRILDIAVRVVFIL